MINKLLYKPEYHQHRIIYNVKYCIEVNLVLTYCWGNSNIS